QRGEGAPPAAPAPARLVRRTAKSGLPVARCLRSGLFIGAEIPAFGGWDTVIPGIGHGLPPVIGPHGLRNAVTVARMLRGSWRDHGVFSRGPDPSPAGRP